MLLRPGVDNPKSRHSQALLDLRQPVQPFLQAVQQRYLQGRRQELQHHSRKARASAHVQKSLPFWSEIVQQGGAVQHVQPGHALRFPDSCQIHYLVFLQKRLGVPVQILDGPGRNPVIQAVSGQAAFQKAFDHFCSFKRSRISVRSFSSGEGSGGTAGAAGASSFLRWKELRAFTRQNTTKANTRKFSTA